MVGTAQRGLVAFLKHLGTHASASDTRELASVGGYGRRTLQRWLRKLGPDVTFYPSVRYAALGLVHLHAFIERPNEQHLRFPYAGDAAWVASKPGMQSLYLHCLVPSTHLTTVQESLERLGPCVTITTSDGWQDNDLTILDTRGVAQQRTITTPLPRISAAHPVLLARAYPLVVPVATELLAQRRTMHDLWTCLYERMGERIWSFLPARSRRWPRNGKAYVRHAFTLLNRYGLVQQHIVRYHHEQTTELLLITRSLDALEPLRAHAPLLEYFPGRDVLLVRAHGGIGLLKAIIECDAVEAWWFVRREAINRPRVQIERFFDPSGNWTPAGTARTRRPRT